MKATVSGRHLLDILFPLGLLLIFVSTAVTVLLLAADVYGDITERSAQAYTARTVGAYLTEKVHQNDEKGCVYVADFHGLNSLVLEHPGEQATYCTYIYYYNNALRELLAEKDTEIGPEAGKEVLELNDFRAVQVKENLLRFSCRDKEDKIQTAYVAVQSGGK